MKKIVRYHGSKLPPEYVKAVEKLLGSLENRSYTTHNLPTNEILKQGSIQKLYCSFSSRKIPTGQYWRWNQAKSRQTVHLPLGVVTFYKLTARKSKKALFEAPKCKLWKFEISPHNGKPFYVLWCEKSSTDVSSLACDSEAKSEITLQDLSFLKPFMEPELANQLWPSFHF